MTEKSAWQQYKEKTPGWRENNPLINQQESIAENNTITENIESNVIPVKSVMTKYEKDDFISIDFIKNQIAPGIWVYSNVFKDSAKLVDDINEHFGASFHDGQVFSADTDRETNKKSRDCSVVQINRTPEDDSGRTKIYNLVRTSMLTCLRDYCSYYGTSINELIGDEWQVLKYGYQQHFEGHADDGFRFPRTISITAYLNDEYTGGEVLYKHFNLTYKPKAGDVLIFPSNYVYNHQVVPVETGVRYALVNWFRWCTMKVDMLIK